MTFIPHGIWDDTLALGILPMYGDISRDSFDPCKSYSRVLMQQGRPLTDADWNEQVSILAAREWALIRSLLGQDHGTFDGGFFYDGGFCPGSYYVNGLRCRLKERIEPSGEKFASFIDHEITQSSLGGQRETKSLIGLIVLEAWEHAVEPTQDAGMLEPTLAGQDTARRAKTAWRLKAFRWNDKEPPPNTDCASFRNGIRVSPPSERTLWLRNRPAALAQPTPVCENNRHAEMPMREESVYRVEVHRAGKAIVIVNGQGDQAVALAGMTFKWSRDNGSSIYAIHRPGVSESSSEIRLDEDRFASILPLVTGDYVELLDQQGRSYNEGRLLPLRDVSRSRITFEPNGRFRPDLEKPDPTHVMVLAQSDEPLQHVDRQYFLRRWHHLPRATANASSPEKAPSDHPNAQPLPTGTMLRRDILARCANNQGILADDGCLYAVADVPGGKVWLELEHGIQIGFDADVDYAEGDYWLIRTSALSKGGFVHPIIFQQPRQTAPPAENGQARNPATAQVEVQLALSGSHHFAPMWLIEQSTINRQTRPVSTNPFDDPIDPKQAASRFESPIKYLSCWNGKSVGSDESTKCRQPDSACPANKENPPVRGAAPKSGDRKDDGRKDAENDAERQDAAPAGVLDPQLVPPAIPAPKAQDATLTRPVLSPVACQALRPFLNFPREITRRVPARHLNYEAVSPSYRRFRAALLVSDILEPTFEAYFAKVQRCIPTLDDERDLIEADARADYDLAAEFQQILAPTRIRPSLV